MTKLNNDNNDLTSNGHEYVLIDDNRSAEIIDMFRDDYLPDETASRALGLSLNEEFKDTIRAQVLFQLKFAIISPIPVYICHIPRTETMTLS